MIKFLFGLRFNLFDMIAYLVTIVLIDAYGSYWWLLLLAPAMWVSVKMGNKLEIRKVLEERQRGYGK